MSSSVCGPREQEGSQTPPAATPVAPGATARLLGQLGVAARADAVFAKPVRQGAVTVIPVANVRWGGGQGSDGSGGGLIASPSGFIELRDGEARFRPAAGLRRAGLAVAAGVVGALAGCRAFARASAGKNATRSRSDQGWQSSAGTDACRSPLD